MLGLINIGTLKARVFLGMIKMRIREMAIP